MVLCGIISFMNTLEKNKQYIVIIDGYSSEAFGVARVEGRAVFIPGTIQGEVWEIRILKITNTAIYGKGIKCLKASPHRVQPKCPAYPQCGGCGTMHMDYEEELSFKLQKVNDALQHIGKQKASAQFILRAEYTEHYRNKGIFNIATNGESPTFLRLLIAKYAIGILYVVSSAYIQFSESLHNVIVSPSLQPIVTV